MEVNYPKIMNCWKMIIYLFAFWEGFMVPYDTAFHMNPHRNSLLIPAFAIDFLISLRDLFAKEQLLDQQVGTMKVIMRSASHARFWVEIIAALPLYELLSNNSFGESAMLYRAVNLIKLVSIWGWIKISNQSFKLTFRLIFAVVWLLVYIHFTACLFYFVAEIDKQWIPQMTRFTDIDEFYEEDTTTKYLACIYTSVMALSGNEINPVSNLHIGVASFFTVVGALIMANIFGTLTVVFTTLNRKSEKLQEMLDRADSSMINMRLSPALQNEIRGFMLKTQNNLDNQRELDNFMMTISPSLRTKVVKHIVKDVIASSPVFSGVSDLVEFLVNDV